jgi:hypothetical protein
MAIEVLRALLDAAGCQAVDADLHRILKLPDAFLGAWVDYGMEYYGYDPIESIEEVDCRPLKQAARQQRARGEQIERPDSRGGTMRTLWKRFFPVLLGLGVMGVPLPGTGKV